MISSRVPSGTVDAHVHAGLRRYGPIEPYVATMDRVGLRQAVLVQHLGEFDNTYLLDAARQHPGRFAVVGLVDLSRPSAMKELRRWAAEGMVGVRLRADATLGGSLDALWELLDELGLVASITPLPELVTSGTFAERVRRFPPVRVRLEHLGGLKHGTASMQHPETRAFLQLAELPNVSTMWSGFWLNATSEPPYPEARRLVRASLAAFGPDRICWSGDWNRPGPPEGQHIPDERYLTEASLVETVFGIDDATAREAILGGTARSLFRLPARA